MILPPLGIPWMGKERHGMREREREREGRRETERDGRRETERQ